MFDVRGHPFDCRMGYGYKLSIVPDNVAPWYDLQLDLAFQYCKVVDKVGVAVPRQVKQMRNASSECLGYLHMVRREGHAAGSVHVFVVKDAHPRVEMVSRRRFNGVDLRVQQTPLKVAHGAVEKSPELVRVINNFSMTKERLRIHSWVVRGAHAKFHVRRTRRFVCETDACSSGLQANGKLIRQGEWEETHTLP